MKLHRLIIKIIFFIFLHSSILGQFVPDSLSLNSYPNQNKIFSSFDKLLNTSNLNSYLRFAYNTRDWNFYASENYKSTVIISSVKSLTEEHYLSSSFSYSLADYFKPGFAIKHSLYSGDKRLTINQASYLNMIFFSNIIPLKNIVISPFGGYSNNEQVGEKDSGPIYGIEAELQKYRLENFLINSTAKFQNEDISPRKNTIRKINLIAENDFQKTFQNQLYINYSQMRKDFYFAADSIINKEFNVINNLQDRTETNYFIQDYFTYRGNSPISIGLQGAISQREIDRTTRYISQTNISLASFDSRIEEFRLDFQSIIDYRISDFANNIKIGYSEREENHTAKPIDGANEIIYNERQRNEEKKSNRSQLITLGYSGSFELSTNDMLSISFFHRKLKYDTPSEENFDDRDEILSTVGIRYLRSLNPFFNILLNVDGSLNHIAYIFSERSANNNINRSLRFQGGGTYSGKHLLTQNIAEVSANYTTYDFEDINPNLKSFSFRQFALKDSTVWEMNKKLIFEFLGYLKLSEQGDFNWKEFSGRPVRYLEELYFEPKFSTLYLGMKLSIGLRYFSLSTFNFDDNNNKKLQSNYKSIGPLTEIKYLLNQSVVINMYGYYEFINSENNIGSERVNLFLNIDWNF